MIIVYQHHAEFKTLINESNCNLLKNPDIWIDILNPTHEEEALLERELAIEIPTRAEMIEIEPSSRLYTDFNHLYLTVSMVIKSETPEVKNDVVTFILGDDHLITIRYVEPHSFAIFAAHLKKAKAKEFKANRLLISLFETTIDRLADVLENLSNRLETLSQHILTQNNDNRINYSGILQHIGRSGDLCAKVRESLVSHNRAVSYLEYMHGKNLPQDLHSRLLTLSKDIQALSDHASFMANKMTFLLDATLGMINIEQNNIIKIFSVAAVIFLPPTLIASIYGMNFHFMPELNWWFGYPFAILLMIISAYLPFRYFKKKKWL